MADEGFEVAKSNLNDAQVTWASSSTDLVSMTSSEDCKRD